MYVVRVAHLVSTPLFSGPLPPTLLLAQAQARLGAEVSFGFDTLRRHTQSEEPAEPFVTASALPLLPVGLSTKSWPLHLLTDRRLLRRLQLDVLHCHLSHDHALARLARNPALLVRTIHSARSLTTRWGQRWLFTHTDGFVVRCQAHADLLHGFGISPERVAVIHGSVEHTRFRPPATEERRQARARFGYPDDALVVGCVAHMDGRPHDVLLDALIGASKWWALLVGSGPDEPRLRSRAEQPGTRVRFAGYVPYDKLHEAYWAMDAAWIGAAGNDASCRNVLEAHACGLPVISGPDPTLAELASPERGVQLTKLTAEDCREALHRVAAHAAPMALAARTYIENNCRPEQEAEKTLTFYVRGQR